LDLIDSNPYASTLSWKVSNIIEGGQWKLSWPSLGQIWNEIISIPISEYQDCWIWTASANEKFTLSSAWELSRAKYPIADYHSVIWFPNACPKFSCCLLRAIHDRLLTRQRLLNFGIINTNDCVLCNSQPETIEHLFFSCVSSSYIWKLCKLKLGLSQGLIGSLLEEVILVKRRFSEKTKASLLAKHAIGAAVWHIWQERNRRIFRAQTMHKILVFRRLYEDINILIQTCSWKVNTKDLSILANWGVG